VVEIGECFSEIFEQRIAQEHGFADVSHRLEFFGLCPDCQTT
jgi:Fe2+ or Zn2+ uptake regulation protein